MDIIFCTLVVPGMMFLFPVGEWLLAQPHAVMVYLLWLYGVWFLCRKAVGPLFVLDKKSIALALGSLFLVGVVTFLMSISPAHLDNPLDGFGKMKLYQRAMWTLLITVVSYGVPVGALAARNRELSSDRLQEQTQQNAQTALDTRKAEAFTEAGADDIQVKAGYRTVHVPLSAIRYIEGRNNYACFHLDHREDVVSQIPLKGVMALLPEGKFVRIHRSYIVPVWRIEKRTATAVKLMGIEEPLPVGRAFKEELSSSK